MLMSRMLVGTAQVTHTFTFNPKCIKMGELYGEYNLLTNEWTDGLGSTLIRNAVADTTPDKKWVVFDGPVDAIWIENMNTGAFYALCDGVGAENQVLGWSIHRCTSAVGAAV